MFYLNELLFRLKFLLLSWFLVLSCCSFYKNNLLLLVSFSLLALNSNSSTIFNNFIYTHPIELLKIQFFSSFVLSLIIMIPYFLWTLFDFLRSSLTTTTYKVFVNLIVIIFFSVLTINLFSISYLLPILWIFFQTFNHETNSKTFNFFLELRVQEYFDFVLEFLYSINIFAILCLILLFLAYFFGISWILRWRKLFIFFNLLIATILTPPDVITQLVCFWLLSFVFELLLFIKLYYFYLKVYIKKLLPL